MGESVAWASPVCGLVEALSVTVTEPVRAPVAVGVNVTLMVHVPRAGTVPPHVFVSVKSPLAAILVRIEHTRVNEPRNTKLRSLVGLWSNVLDILTPASSTTWIGQLSSTGGSCGPSATVESLRDRPQPDVAPGVLLHAAFVHRISPCPDSTFILAVAPGSSWSLRSRGPEATLFCHIFNRERCGFQKVLRSPHPQHCYPANWAHSSGLREAAR